jgi:UPF0755 protein
MKRVLLVMTLMVALSLMSGCAGVLEKYNGPVDESDTSTFVVTVAPGSSTTGIANLLLEEGLIQNVNAFKARVKLLEVDGKMKAGDYMLSPSMSSDAIIEKLVDGKVYVETNKFTIPEGFEIRQIVDKLAEQGIVDRDVFLDVLENHPFDYAFLEGVDRSKRLEGYLFPDTYEVLKSADEVAIVNKMLKRFGDVFKPEYYARAEELGMTIDEVVTLASIIEREARVAEEFEIVSSVFHNRMEIGMALQSCATVQYILQERKPVLSYADTEIKDPYNTYINSGLTPSPIASPGELAIKSALYPAETNYLFFVTTEKNDGTHYFNETLAGHNRDAKKGN